MTSENGNLFIATAVERSGRTVRLRFDGESEAGSKFYKVLNGAAVTAGYRVLVLKISGTYLVLGMIY